MVNKTADGDFPLSQVHAESCRKLYRYKPIRTVCGQYCTLMIDFIAFVAIVLIKSNDKETFVHRTRARLDVMRSMNEVNPCRDS